MCNTAFLQMAGSTHQHYSTSKQHVEEVPVHMLAVHERYQLCDHAFRQFQGFILAGEKIRRYQLGKKRFRHGTLSTAP